MNKTCNETIDIEEKIMELNKDFKFIKYTVLWKSGRVEEIHAKLDKNKMPSHKILKKIKDYKNFETVVSVREEKY